LINNYSKEVTLDRQFTFVRTAWLQDHVILKLSTCNSKQTHKSYTEFKHIPFPLQLLGQWWIWKSA